MPVVQTIFDDRQTVFVGGPWNGRMLRVAKDLRAVMAHETDACVRGGFAAYRYVIEELRAGPESFFIARLEEIPLEMCLRLILEGFMASRGGRSLYDARGRDFYQESTAIARADRFLKSMQAELMVPCPEPSQVEIERGILTAPKVRKWRGDALAAAKTQAFTVSIDPDAPCDDCKSTRTYTPFTGPSIPCPTCRPPAAPHSPS